MPAVAIRATPATTRSRSPAASRAGSTARTRAEITSAAGDRDLVADGVERVVAGTGATRQRQAFETGGDLGAVVRDAVERTEAAAL